MNDEALHIVEHPADDSDAPVIVLVHGTLDNSLVAQELTLVQEPPFAFGDVAVPCLIGRSTLTTPWHVESTTRLAEIFAADLVVIEDAGHTAHRTQPKAFADFARHAVALGRAAR